MSKKMIVARAYDHLKGVMKRKEVETAYDAIVKSLRELIVEEERVSLEKVVSFETKVRKPRKCMNLQTMEQFVSEPTKYVKPTISPILKQEMKDKPVDSE